MHIHAGPKAVGNVLKDPRFWILSCLDWLDSESFISNMF